LGQEDLFHASSNSCRPSPVVVRDHADTPGAQSAGGSVAPRLNGLDAVHERGGQPRFALDLVEAALGRIKLTANTTIVEPARFTPALLSNTFDGSGAAWKDAERERALIFSQPYLENRPILVGRKDEDVSAASLTDLKGKRIAIVEGYVR
jgi:ABC-type amino acid transport substrate-binding protein